jgi:GAF domain-containing protein
MSADELSNLVDHSQAGLDANERVTEMASSILDPDELFNKILDEIFIAVQPERASILLIDPKSEQLTVKASRSQDKKGVSHRVGVSQSVIDHVFKKKESIFINDAMYDPQFSLKRSVILHGIRSAMCSPIRGSDGIIGVIHVDRAIRGSEFGKEDLSLLDAIANAAGIAIENAQLDQDKD